MLRFFFGYYDYHGMWWPLAWIEDDGQTVGVKPHCQSHDVFEISAEEFVLSLQELVQKYPRKEVAETTVVVEAKPT